MMLHKLVLFTLLIITLNSCKDGKKSPINAEQNKSIPGDYFENDSAGDLNDQGIAFSKNGDYKKGNELFLKALELEPNNPTTLSNLGLNSHLAHDYDNAVKYYRESYQISDSTYHIAAINLGLTYFYRKEFDKGISITNYVIENTDDKDILSTAYVHRALNYLGNDQCEKAQTDLNYITANFQGIGNTAYHIKDLTRKLKTCLHYNQ
ncbi:tetratricopeptide repeat protein [Cellulophaga sp. Ld12]|uniref:tetratricopeptide repeat protein n=1 Tax=Cellulophaga sp. Ld12 TaxID=3229535 RepID=UPI0038636218